MTSTPALLAPPPGPAPEPMDDAGPARAAMLALRKTGLGGSDAGPALGLSPFTSRTELFLDKLDLLPPKPLTGPLEWGTLIEPVVRGKFVRVTGRDVFVPTTTFRSEKYPFMLANLDGLMPGRLYEGKTARTADGWGEPGSADIPEHITLQVQHYMSVTAMPVTDVAVLIGGSDFRIYEVPADRELQQMIIEGEAEFWQHVVDRRPPPVESLEDARLRWGGLAATGLLNASEADMAAAAQLVQIAAQQKELELLANSFKAYLMTVLGDGADTLIGPDGKPVVTWKLAKAPARFDVESFAAEHPGLYADYLRTGTASRRFLLKGTAAA